MKTPLWRKHLSFATHFEGPFQGGNPGFWAEIRVPDRSLLLERADRKGIQGSGQGLEIVHAVGQAAALAPLHRGVIETEGDAVDLQQGGADFNAQGLGIAAAAAAMAVMRSSARAMVTL